MAHLRVASGAAGLLLLAWLTGLPHAEAGRRGRERLTQWRGDVQVSQFDCRTAGTSQITVIGTVRLLNAEPGQPNADGAAPDEAAARSPRPIHVFCERLNFAPGSKLVTASDLDLRISGVVSGLVVIEGQAGEAALRQEVPRSEAMPDRAPSGAAGTTGLSARAASLKTAEDRAPSPPQPGRRGGAGGNGMDGVNGPAGRPGVRGSNGNALTLLAGSFAPDATVEMMSPGGNGGSGGRGGRGQDGGRGGHGGRGGDGNGPGGGGDGGPGGNGGRGGDAGAGGDGGDGGGGGSLIFGVRADGVLPALPPRFDNRGGQGGDPGAGGRAGIGGPAGLGGPGGPATTDLASADAIAWERGGSAGVTGPPGQEGGSGVAGLPGQRGRLGRLGYASWGMIAVNRFTELMRPQ